MLLISLSVANSLESLFLVDKSLYPFSLFFLDKRRIEIKMKRMLRSQD